MDKLTEDAREWLDAAGTADEWRFRKGFFDGHVKTLKLLTVLISQGEVGDKEWAQQQVAGMLAPYRGILLGQEEELEGLPGLPERAKRLIRRKVERS